MAGRGAPQRRVIRALLLLMAAPPGARISLEQLAEGCLDSDDSKPLANSAVRYLLDTIESGGIALDRQYGVMLQPESRQMLAGLLGGTAAGEAPAAT